MDLEITLQVEYTVVDKPKEGRYWPIDIKSVMWRDQNIYPFLTVDDVLTLQRRVYNRLDNESLREEV